MSTDVDHEKMIEKALAAVAQAARASCGVSGLENSSLAALRAIARVMGYPAVALVMVNHTDSDQNPPQAGPSLDVLAVAGLEATELATETRVQEQFHLDAEAAESGICAPVHSAEDTSVYALALAERDYVFTDEDRAVFSCIAACLSPVVERELLRAKLEVVSQVDTLTGLYNRRHLVRRVSEEINRASRGKTVFSIVFFDVVGMREMNSSYGHQMGDLVLQAAASALTCNARESDVPARYGDDEFALLLPGADEPRAQVVANRVTRSARQQVIACGDSRIQGPDLHWWVTCYPADGLSVDDLIGAG